MLGPVTFPLRMTTQEHVSPWYQPLWFILHCPPALISGEPTSPPLWPSPSVLAAIHSGISLSCVGLVFTWKPWLNTATQTGIEASSHPDPWWPDKKTSGRLTHLGFVFMHMVWHQWGLPEGQAPKPCCRDNFPGLLKSSRACIQGQGFFNQGTAGCGGESICCTHY